MITIVRPEQHVTTNGNSSQATATALGNGEYFIAWNTTLGTTGEFFDSLGSPIYSVDIFDAGSSVFSTYGSLTPSAATTSTGEVVVGLATYSTINSNTDYYITVVRLAPGDSVPSNSFQVTGSADQLFNARISAVGHAGDYVVAWTDAGPGNTEHVYAQLLDGSDQKIGATIALSNITNHADNIGNVAGLANGNFVASWTDLTTQATMARVFSSSGSSVTGNIFVGSTEASPYAQSDVAGLSDGNFVVTWTESYNGGSAVHAKMYSSDGAVLTGDITLSAGYAYEADVTAASDGTFFVTWWESVTSSGSSSIYGELFDSSGAPIGSKSVINTTAGSSDFYPVPTMLSDGHIIDVFQTDSNTTVATDVNAQLVSPVQPLVAEGNFNGTGFSDLLFRNGVTGDVGFFQIHAGDQFTWTDLGQTSTHYGIVGVGDFTHDGISDVLFRNSSTGDVGFYQLNSNGNVQSWHDIASSSTSYDVVGVGGFANDGNTDVLFRNNTTGDLGYYQLSSTGAFENWRQLATSSTKYDVVGVGDFTGKGRPDILFRDASTGDVGFYSLDQNGNFQNWHDVGSSSTAYSIAGLADFNGDHIQDILFRNASTGDVGFYGITATGYQWHDVASSSTAYSVVGTGDYNGDGISDIMFRNQATGDLGYYQLGHDGSFNSWHHLGGSASSYAVMV
ncbi:FG-GAP-like repeat-containing protein [Bradyrhizobium sp. USDA 4529]